MVKQKAKEWLKRYLPPEIAGTITAVAGASITHLFSSNLIMIAYVGSLSEGIGFYATVFVQQLFRINKKNKAQNKGFSILNLSKLITDMALEFGPAGFLDGLILRPFFMYVFPSVLKNFTLGILVGKLVGDVTFYLLVILSYEIKKQTINIYAKSNRTKHKT